jgi:hypothetical protein
MKAFRKCAAVGALTLIISALWRRLSWGVSGRETAVPPNPKPAGASHIFTSPQSLMSLADRS